jgi:hypothetical protein
LPAASVRVAHFHHFKLSAHLHTPLKFSHPSQTIALMHVHNLGNLVRAATSMKLCSRTSLHAHRAHTRGSNLKSDTWSPPEVRASHEICRCASACGFICISWAQKWRRTSRNSTEIRADPHGSLCTPLYMGFRANLKCRLTHTPLFRLPVMQQMWSLSQNHTAHTWRITNNLQKLLGLTVESLFLNRKK